jgi:division protein CdvB (Snf7/Vps24/ESCRT-III family)
MMQSMKGATVLLGSMNRQMNLPALQRIVMEFERENEIMDERQEMMDDAIDEATGLEDEEESEDIVKEVLDEIGVDLGQAVIHCYSFVDHYIQCTDLPTVWGDSGRNYQRRGRRGQSSPGDWGA